MHVAGAGAHPPPAGSGATGPPLLIAGRRAASAPRRSTLCIAVSSRHPHKERQSRVAEMRPEMNWKALKERMNFTSWFSSRLSTGEAWGGGGAG